MENQEERAAKREAKESWRKCPICGQEFEAFLPLIKHVEEDCRRESQMVKVELGGKDYLAKRIAQEFLPSLQGSGPDRRRGRRQSGVSKRKVADEAKGLLSVVADWLEQALTNFSEINSIVTSDLKVAEELVGLAQRLPDDFREQRDYLLKHQGRLKETGMDPKWPRKAGGQIRFVAESMAGAEWNLSPSTSREFIRLQKPRRGAIPAVPQRWWDPRSTSSDKDEKEEEEQE
jgi:hypothetical protein